MLLRIALAALLLSAPLIPPALARATASTVAPVSPKEESDRLRADMEGQVERLRLTVETFMASQERRLGEALVAQDRHTNQLRQTVLMLAGLSALLAVVAVALAVALDRSRRRNRSGNPSMS